MADKEERILVLHETGEYLCNKLNDDIPCENKYNCLECKLGISRSEILYRMAKDIRKKLFKNEWPTQEIKEEGLEQEYNRYVDFMCEFIAEAALNALLEEHK